MCKQTVKCSVCGSENVQLAVWVNPNTGKVYVDFGEWDETDTKWCESCQEHVLLVTDLGGASKCSEEDHTLGCSERCARAGKMAPGKG